MRLLRWGGGFSEVSTGRGARNSSGVAVDATGNLFIADRGRFNENNGRIRKVDDSGPITTVAAGVNGGLGDGGPATSAQLNGPQGATPSAPPHRGSRVRILGTAWAQNPKKSARQKGRKPQPAG